jgi:hypothetical protein
MGRGMPVAVFSASFRPSNWSVLGAATTGRGIVLGGAKIAGIPARIRCRASPNPVGPAS